MSTVNALRPTRTPGRPGPGPLPAALLRKVDLTVRRRIDGLLAGDHRSWATGDGTELAQVRPYAPGDDVRMIDWNVTARTGEPHVRVNVAERAVETWLLLDDGSWQLQPIGISSHDAEWRSGCRELRHHVAPDIAGPTDDEDTIHGESRLQL